MAAFTVVYFKKVQAKSPTMFPALIFVSVFLFLIEVGLFITAVVLLFTQSGGPIKYHILVILLIIPLTGLGFGCCFGHNQDNQNSPISPAPQIVIFLLASMTCYHFCWIVIGVMMNALWGVSVVLFICVVVVVLVFIFSKFIQKLEAKLYKPAMLYLSLILPFLSLVSLVILNGQSFFVTDTTDKILKTVFLSVIAAIMSWTGLTANQQEGNMSANVTQVNGSANVTQGNGSANVTRGNGSANVTRGNGSANVTRGNGSANVTQGNESANVTRGNGSANVTRGNGSANVTRGNGSANVTQGNGSKQALLPDTEVEAETTV